MIRTGWGRFWPGRKKYLGTDKPGDAAGLHFPGNGAEAANALVSRNIRAAGIDTPSLDYGRSKDREPGSVRPKHPISRKCRRKAPRSSRCP